MCRGGLDTLPKAMQLLIEAQLRIVDLHMMDMVDPSLNAGYEQYASHQLRRIEVCVRVRAVLYFVPGLCLVPTSGRVKVFSYKHIRFGSVVSICYQAQYHQVWKCSSCFADSCNVVSRMHSGRSVPKVVSDVFCSMASACMWVDPRTG